MQTRKNEWIASKLPLDRIPATNFGRPPRDAGPLDAKEINDLDFLRDDESERCSMSAAFRPGDVVVYRKQKNSLHPGPHARDIHPARHGDSYSYAVEKFWRVVAVQPDNTLVVRTRRGKQHTLAANDPNLRRVHWWERLLFWQRFPPHPPSG